MTGADDYDRLLEELAQANRRLSGILEIVLSTIDSGDVGVLFSRVMEQINQTMAAGGTLLYLLENGRLHLRGYNEDIDLTRVPTRLAPERLHLMSVVGTDEALRLRVLPPSRDDLRRGALGEREVSIEGRDERIRVSQQDLPPFASMLLTPVSFGGRLIAVLVTGWAHARQLSVEDARLLGAVGRYLSTQLAGAISTLRQQHRIELADAGATVREALRDGSTDLDPRTSPVATLVAEALRCEFCLLREDGMGERGLELLRVQGTTHVPELRLSDVCGEGELVRVREGDELDSRLYEGDLPSQCVVADLCDTDSGHDALLLAREADDDPFDDLEIAFVQRLCDDIRDARASDEERSHDRRISQALQTGMRNQLQTIEGLEAQGLYSSATQAAFVGGDFYDLIRLPEHRACVIMGDVSGKGVEAASVSAAVRTALGAYSWEGLRPARMVALLNEFLLGFSRLETFATLFVGIIDVPTGRMEYCSAGHPPAIVARASSGELELCDVQSGVVGAFSEMTYRNGALVLAPGDILMLYTDGTTEARAQDGAFFGEEGLREALLAELPLGFEGMPDRLLARLDDFTERHLDDDIAMVALRYDGPDRQQTAKLDPK